MRLVIRRFARPARRVRGPYSHVTIIARRRKPYDWADEPAGDG